MIKKLPLGLRLFLNVLAFSVPIVVLTYLMYDSESTNVNFSAKEAVGNKLQVPYEELWQEVVMTKLMPQRPHKLEERLSTLKKTLHEVGEELQFTPEGLSSRKREFVAIDKLESAIAKQDWDQAITSIKAGISHLGDTSNLILDPDLDSYYMMDITLLALPQMQDRVQTILANQATFFATPQTEEARIQAALYSSLLKEADLARIVGDHQTSLNEDGNFYGISPSLQANLPVTVEELSKKTQTFTALLDKIARAETVEPKAFAEAGLHLLSQTYDSWHVSVAELNQLIKTRVDTLTAQRSKSLYMAGLALLAAIVFSIFVGHSVSDSIKQILKSVLKLKDLSGSVLTVGSQLKETAATVNQAVTSQSAAIEETAASVEEINSMVGSTAANSRQASELARMTTEAASLSRAEVDTMLASMNEIAKSSRKIVETISVIDDIAFQTNLLALNASVEAARAGEQGKGFAVVAEAVRALAQKSAQAAKEINELVKDNVVIIDQGKLGAEKSSQSLQQILDYIGKLSTLIHEIATASGEQSTGISQISAALNNIETDAMKNQEGLQTVSTSSDSLCEESNELNHIIGALEAEVLGSKKQPKGLTA